MVVVYLQGDFDNFLQNMAITDADPALNVVKFKSMGKWPLAMPDGLCAQTAHSDPTD